MFQITAKEGRCGKIFIDDTARIKDSIYVDLSANITISPHVEIQDNVRIYTHKHDWKHSRGLRRDTEKISFHELVIDEDAFIGANSILLGISRIGKGAIIGAGSVVTHDIPDYEIWAGVPGKKIGERND